MFCRAVEVAAIAGGGEERMDSPAICSDLSSLDWDYGNILITVMLGLADLLLQDGRGGTPGRPRLVPHKTLLLPVRVLVSKRRRLGTKGGAQSHRLRARARATPATHTPKVSKGAGMMMYHLDRSPDRAEKRHPFGVSDILIFTGSPRSTAGERKRVVCVFFAQNNTWLNNIR